MTNPFRENDSRNGGLEALEDLVAPSPETETQARSAELYSGAAGNAPTDATRQLTTAKVLELLVRAITDLESSGKTTTAAGVSARMRVLEPYFTVSHTEFPNFRSITKAAESAGVVEAVRTASDYVLRLPGRDSSLGPAHRQDRFRGVTLRPDLWRAFQDSNEDAKYAFNRESRTTETLENSPPLGSVSVPSVSKSSNIRWMHEFAAHQDPEISAHLQLGLAEPDPIAGFYRALRENGAAKRLWNRQLRSNILEAAIAWAAENQIDRQDIFLPAPETQRSSTNGPPSQAPTASSADDDPRRRILQILESMPLHELLRLSIPLEYSLNR